MNKATFTTLAIAIAFAAAACDRDGTGGAQRPAASSSQSNPTRPAPPGGQSARPGELSPPPSDQSAQAPRPSPGAGQAATAQNPSSQVGVAAQTTFDIADKDKNGSIDASEASAVQGLNFVAADADKDDALSRQEYMTAMAAARPQG
jgi:hypothetical protein